MPWVASYVAKKNGLILHELSVAYPQSLRELSLDRLAFEVPNVARIRLRGIHLSRLAQGRRDSFLVEVEELHYALDSETRVSGDGPSTEITLSDFLPQKMLPKLPDIKVSVVSASSDSSTLLLQSVNLVIDNLHGVKANLIVQYEKNIRSTVKLSVSNDNSFWLTSLTQLQHEQEKLAIDVQLSGLLTRDQDDVVSEIDFTSSIKSLNGNELTLVKKSNSEAENYTGDVKLSSIIRLPERVKSENLLRSLVVDWQVDLDVEHRLLGLIGAEFMGRLNFDNKIPRVTLLPNHIEARQFTDPSIEKKQLPEDTSGISVAGIEQQPEKSSITQKKRSNIVNIKDSPWLVRHKFANKPAKQSINAHTDQIISLKLEGSPVFFLQPKNIVASRVSGNATLLLLKDTQKLATMQLSDMAEFSPLVLKHIIPLISKFLGDSKSGLPLNVLNSDKTDGGGQGSLNIDMSVDTVLLKHFFPQLNSIGMTSPTVSVKALMHIDQDKVLLNVHDGTSLSLRLPNKKHGKLMFLLPAQNLQLTSKGLETARVDFNLVEAEALPDIKASIEAAIFDSTLKLELENKPFTFKGIRVPTYRLHSSIPFLEDESKQITFAFKNACRQILFDGNLNTSGTRRAALKSLANFTPNSSSLHWLNIERLPLEITQGAWTLNANSKLPGDTQEKGPQAHDHLDARLKNARVVSAAGVFEGVQLAFSSKALSLFSQSDSFESLGFGQIHLEGAMEKGELGFVTKNVEFVADLKLDKHIELYIDRLIIPAFGGLVSIKDQVVPISGFADTTFTLNWALDALDLGQIVATQNMQGLQASGSLSGAVPVVIKKGSFTVSEGQVLDIEGGVIRYQSPMSASVDINEKLKFTLDVLENLKYDVLKTNINYEDGNLMLKSNIQGKNPEVAGGKRVNLNLNTEMQLLAAFETMRLKSGIEDKISTFMQNKHSSQKTSNACEARK